MNKSVYLFLIIPCLIISYYYYKDSDSNYYQCSNNTHILALIGSFITIVYLLNKQCILNDWKSLFIIGFLYMLFGFHLMYQFEINKQI